MSNPISLAEFKAKVQAAISESVRPAIYNLFPFARPVTPAPPVEERPTNPSIGKRLGMVGELLLKALRRVF